MAEQADASDLKSAAGNGVRVNISPGVCKPDRKEVMRMLEIKGKINTATMIGSSGIIFAPICGDRDIQRT